jgi:hypothetical protein
MLSMFWASFKFLIQHHARLLSELPLWVSMLGIAANPPT